MKIILTEEQWQDLAMAHIFGAGRDAWVKKNMPDLADKCWWVRNGVIHILDAEEQQEVIKACKSLRVRLSRPWRASVTASGPGG